MGTMRLSDEKVAAIKADIEAGMGYTDIQVKHEVAGGTVYALKREMNGLPRYGSIGGIKKPRTPKPVFETVAIESAPAPRPVPLNLNITGDPASVAKFLKEMGQ